MCVWHRSVRRNPLAARARYASKPLRLITAFAPWVLMRLSSAVRVRCLLFTASALLLSNCSPRTNVDSALLVKVSVAEASASRCVRVVVTPQTGEAAATEAIVAKSEVSVAVFRGSGWSDDVSVEARGYASCEQASDLAANIEASGAAAAVFPASGTETVLLSLTPGLVDADGDGRPAGPEDCDDTDPTRFVGNVEACTSTVDNNCSQTTGCQDPLCTGGCLTADAGTCNAEGVCRGPEQLACTDGVDNDGDGLIDCMDPDCLSEACDDNNACTIQDVCQLDGGCGGPARVVTCETPPADTCLTGTGWCNPADAGCLYGNPQPEGERCNDQNACTTNDRCVADGGCASATLFVCPARGQCFESGVCSDTFDAGCSYAVRVNQSCIDTNLCTVESTGVCLEDAGCQGAAVVCPPPPNDCRDAGVCDPADGNCDYPSRPNGSACDDGTACTENTTCNGSPNSTCQGGNAVVCPAPADVCFDAGTCSEPTGCTTPPVICTPGACQVGGTCDATLGGCQFTNVAEGTVCPDGGCYQGECLAVGTAFPYTPDNFDRSQAGPNGVLIIDCAATFNTGTATSAPFFSGCAGQLFQHADGGVEVRTQTSNSSFDVTLLRVSALLITDGGTLTIEGDRPALLAVYGDAVIGGVINATANFAAKGAGADSGECVNGSINGGGSTATGGAGAAGGGYALAGGNGGEGDDTTLHGSGASASGTDDIRPLRGGCSGGKGGNPLLPGTEPVGGGGGGALQISAAGRLVLRGTIISNGGGGQGGKHGLPSGEGAGGGGSGGAVRMEGNTVTLRNSLRIYANGGSGGEGGDSNATGGRGANGLNGQLLWSTTPATGDGLNNNHGGVGGGANSGAGKVAPNATNGSKSSGGGGGGSAGRIYLRLNAASISCRETGYVISPSSAAVTGTASAGNDGLRFSTNFGQGPVASCP